MKATTAFLGIVLSLASPLSHAACVGEEDEIVVYGELSRQTFAGPPNYESVTRGDKAETYWILTVRGNPVTFCPLANGNGKPGTLGSVNRFQLAIDENQPALRQALIARYALVRGRIFVAHSGHHHTAALIRVAELRPG
jgi:hypothetical protein